MDFLASTAAGKVVDHISSKFSDCIKNFKGQYDDLKLANAIRQELLDQYGNERFYNDLDSYLTCNKTIDFLILTLRNSSPQPVEGPSEFVNKNLKQFLDRAPSCLAYSSQIKDALLRIFDCTFFAITDMNPYSDCGRLQSEIRVQNAETNAQMQAGFAMLREEFKNSFRFLQNETASRNLPDFSAEMETFKAKIKEIETSYQHEGHFEEALICSFHILRQYHILLKLYNRGDLVKESILLLKEELTPKMLSYAVIQQVITTWLTTQLNTPHK